MKSSDFYAVLTMVSSTPIITHSIPAQNVELHCIKTFFVCAYLHIF